MSDRYPRRPPQPPNHSFHQPHPQQAFRQPPFQQRHDVVSPSPAGTPDAYTPSQSPGFYENPYRPAPHRGYAPVRQDVYSPAAQHHPVHHTPAHTSHQPVQHRQVQLTNGNLIVDIPVPDRVLTNATHRTGIEFTHSRYTACTADPDDFVRENFSLRAAQWQRRTEIFVVMTMYNEDDLLLTRTLHAVIKNIGHLCNRGKSRIWGQNGWQKVVVCIVADGRTKIHPRALTVLGALGVYQDGVAKNSVNGRPVTAHLYEYTTQMSVDTKLRIRGSDSGIVPVQMLFCLKEKNAKKINSHRWFFNAFGQVLRPNVCILLDVGTKPSPTSIYHLWKAFDRDEHVAGACGEICADLGPGGRLLINPLIAAQNFEYKMSNILDKPLESVFGYISVLPGAFSAYRYKALQNVSPNEGPLHSYFKGETMHGADAKGGIFEANMYLAEDRILCFELVAKRNSRWLLKYVKSAKAWTDVPDNVPEFISQRRRWLNGSFFAAFYAVFNFGRIFSASHSYFRIFALMIEFLYNTVNMVFSWFALANFYLSFNMLVNSYTSNNPNYNRDKDPFYGYGDYAFHISRELYLLAIIVIFVSSLGNRPQGSKWIYTLSMVLFSLLMLVMLYCAGYTVWVSLPKNPEEWKRVGNRIMAVPTFRNIVVSLAATYGLYFLTSILHMDPWHMITSFVQYLLIAPSYINVLNIYAFCNTHDVSWGTKGDNGPNNDLGHVKIAGDKDGKDATVDFQVTSVDPNVAYDRLLQDLSVRPKEQHKKRDAATKKEDYYRAFRTRLVLAWIFSNSGLIILFTSDFIKLTSQQRPDQDFNPYLTFVLWSVAGLSAFRAFWSTVYLVLRMIFG